MMRRRLSLRARLLLGVFVLAAVGLSVADAATYTSLRSFLLGRVDKSLDAAHAQVEHRAFGANGRGPGGGDDRGGPPAQGADWYQVRTVSGAVVRGGFLVGGGSPPRIGTVSLPTQAADGGLERVSYFTVSSQDGGTRYRIRASVDPQSPGDVLLMAASLDDVYGTLHRLLLIELLGTLAALAAIAGVGLWVVRLGLRPLREIEATASTIAAGDLSQRVTRVEPTTEVGRLGRSLNAMLAQIESAFRAREASEQQLRRFVADASHELRTPLTAVRAYAELFARGAADRPADLERAMAGITRESERMSVLVEDLLLLARLDEGRPLEQQPVELGDTVLEAVDAARVVDHEREIDVAVEPATVIGDADRLRQVIDNLFANVRAHTPPGTQVSVKLRRVGGDAELEVSDDGPGLTDDEAAQVFHRFYRVDTSRSRASGGVGLGLAIAAAVAEAHGGRAAVTATPGGGATFQIAIPLAADSGRLDRAEQPVHRLLGGADPGVRACSEEQGVR
jgi:two-component system OmpR family sensor kinase